LAGPLLPHVLERNFAAGNISEECPGAKKKGRALSLPASLSIKLPRIEGGAADFPRRLLL